MPSRPKSARKSDPERTALLYRIRQLERAARPLEPGAAGRRKLRNAAVASSERFLREIETTIKAYQDTEDKGIGLLDSPIAEHGIPIEAAIEILEQHVIRPGANPASGGHLAYIPGGPLYHAALGDFLAAVNNKYPAVFFTGPGPVRMENMLIRWVADLVGYPAAAGATSRPEAASPTWWRSSRRAMPTASRGPITRRRSST